LEAAVFLVIDLVVRSSDLFVSGKPVASYGDAGRTRVMDIGHLAGAAVDQSQTSVVHSISNRNDLRSGADSEGRASSM
jgi:hypothetical protein